MPRNLRQHPAQAAARPAPSCDVTRRSRHTELLLNCARIGYNP